MSQRTRRMRHGVGMSLGLVALTTLVACTATDPAPTTSSAPASPTPSSAAASEHFLGEWVSPDDAAVTLTLSADGTLVAFDGCNSHSGTWVGPNGGTIGLEFTSSTEAGCPEGVVPWLTTSDGAIVDGPEVALTLFGPTDAETGSLVRADG
ncbi:META domain-containing protein [Microbacterium galbinum]|uniref:META domain-containing protein n=1 Tax=Microbacterium galbinum TaxID=2851646 RepID=A0ABY4IMD5_9MICO|nr:META domain-containing protein [Microbacterium galbinum]UPL13922.1 META domain-containing protein [Microbacterium galbinum]